MSRLTAEQKIKELAPYAKAAALYSVLTFGLGTNPKTPQLEAMLGLMVTAVAAPVVVDFTKILHGLSDRIGQLIETTASGGMIAAVGLMGMGAIANVKQSPSAKLLLSGVALFAFSVTLNFGYNVLMLLGIIKRKPLVELIAGGSGFIGSLGFLGVQVLNYLAARQSGDEAGMNAAKHVMVTAIGFIFVTGFQAGVALTAMREQPSRIEVWKDAVAPEVRSQASIDDAGLLDDGLPKIRSQVSTDDDADASSTLAEDGSFCGENRARLLSQLTSLLVVKHAHAIPVSVSTALERPFSTTLERPS